MTKPKELQKHIKGYSIVMADDDIEDQKLVKEAFRDAGINHVFTSVYNGMQLMDFLQKKGSYSNAQESPPDLIIVDVRMSLMDGFETITQIRSQKKFNKIPTFILTTSHSADDKKKAFELGINGFYTKPSGSGALTKIVKEICDLGLKAAQQHIVENKKYNL